MYEELAKTPHLRTSDKLFGHPVWSLLGWYMGLVKEICPRGNNKVVNYISLYHDKCLLFMLELY